MVLMVRSQPKIYEPLLYCTPQSICLPLPHSHSYKTLWDQIWEKSSRHELSSIKSVSAGTDRPVPEAQGHFERHLKGARKRHKPPLKEYHLN